MDSMWIQPWMTTVTDEQIRAGLVGTGILGKNVAAGMKREKLCLRWNEAVQNEPEKMAHWLKEHPIIQGVISRTTADAVVLQTK
jgi:hypothetical protein